MRIGDNVKRRTKQACAKIGISLSTIINIYLKNMGREKRVPFEVSIDLFYLQESITRLRRFVAEIPVWLFDFYNK